MIVITVDIDTGGTMTDALVSDGATYHAFKVDTTPYDYTVSFLECLKEAASHLKYNDVADFLEEVALIRWSSTITTNVLAERRGSNVGLIVSQGHEKTLYGESSSPVLGEIVAEENVIGLSDNPTPVEVLGAVKELLEGGVRRICVCLANAFPENASERAVKEVIEGQYPDHIIGSVPVLLGSEMASLRHDQTRAHFALMNAYTHTQLASSLFKAEDLLRDGHRWRGPLLIGHASGGVARIGKTKAVDTIESGPVFGAFGGAYMAKLYELSHVICLDVGGTTTKASVVKNGAPVFQRRGNLMGIPVKASLVMLRSAAVGGGSIARVKGRVLTLGPESTGAAPGPACYGLGGREATLTDALVILGYLDPANFFGGRRILDVDLARVAIEEKVAKPLDVSVEVAALSIRDEAVAIITELIENMLAETDGKTADTALFAFGGNGPMFAAFITEMLGIPSAHTFDLGPVFSTFGSAISNVVHRYERGLIGHWDADTVERLKPIAADMTIQAVRDLRGEGFDPDQAIFAWEVDLGKSEESVSNVEMSVSGPHEDIANKLDEAVKSAGLDGESLLAIRLSTSFSVGGHAIVKRTEVVNEQPPGTREVRFNGGVAGSTPIYQWEALNVGDTVVGPAVINGETFTCPVPPGWSATLDDYGNAQLTRVK